MIDVAIIGAGIAGCMTAYQVQQAGLEPILIERHADVAMEASGNPYGLVMPQLSVGQTTASVFNDQAYAAAIRFYQDCPIEKYSDVIQLAVNSDDEIRFKKLSETHKWHPDFCRPLDNIDAGALLGANTTRSALYFPQALTLSPKKLCQFLSRNVQKLLAQDVLSFHNEFNCWHIRNADNDIVAVAKNIVIANSFDALRFPPTADLPLRARRGQLTYLPQNENSHNIKCSFTFGGYMTQAIDGLHILGATYENPRANASELTVMEHQKNLAKLQAIMPDLFPEVAVETLSGRAAVRCTTPNHQPIVKKLDTVSNGYVLTGLGSRALTTAVFCAQIIIDGIKPG